MLLAKSCLRKLIECVFYPHFLKALLLRVEERNQARKDQLAAKASGVADKHNYVPRKANTFAQSGLVGSGGKSAPDEPLDDASRAGLSKLQAKDRAIDADLNDISMSIDRLANIATTIKDEVRSISDCPEECLMAVL